MASARIAMAGLVPLCEKIIEEALARRPELQRVEKWTSLSSLYRLGPPELPEILLIPLARPPLPEALRVLLAAAPGLRIVALNDDCSAATVFEVREQRYVHLDRKADDLCELIFRSTSGPLAMDPPMSHH